MKELPEYILITELAKLKNLIGIFKLNEIDIDDNWCRYLKSDGISFTAKIDEMKNIFNNGKNDIIDVDNLDFKTDSSIGLLQILGIF